MKRLPLLAALAALVVTGAQAQSPKLLVWINGDKAYNAVSYTHLRAHET